MDINLNTPQEMADRANRIKNKLHHKQKNFTCEFKFTKSLKKIYLIWRF